MRFALLPFKDLFVASAKIDMSLSHRSTRLRPFCKPSRSDASFKMSNTLTRATSEFQDPIAKNDSSEKGISEPLLVRAARGEPVERAPCW